MSTLTNLLHLPAVATLKGALLAGSLIVGVSPAWAGGGGPLQQSRYLEVREVQGNVTSQQQPVQVGDRVQARATAITTGEDSGTTLVLDNNTGTVAVAENTQLAVDQVSTTPTGGQQTELSLQEGELRANIQTLTNPESSFRVNTPAGVAGVRGTEFSIVVLPTGETRVTTFEGLVEVTAQGQTELIQPGYFSQLTPGQPPTEPRLAPEDTRLSLQFVTESGVERLQVTAIVPARSEVLLNQQPLPVSPAGEVSAVVDIPGDRLLRMVVRDPFGVEQVYELALPRMTPTEPETDSPGTTPTETESEQIEPRETAPNQSLAPIL
ncbi:MAG: FecR domain-containing protein [Leptolyngbyaceae cyanobacterium SL_5_14]|nr:FecR domain-containing protein [Leptolyngbyaceae cyanobacterium SL_5_14]